MTAPRPPRARLWLFAFGDFAFNLFWQSVMLFLLFYYTEAAGLPMETASLTYLVASIWDGIANFLAGIRGERRPGAQQRVLVLGALPLGCALMLAYLPPLAPGAAGVAMVLAGHLLFRTAYAFLNVPYMALHARVSADSGDRALVAGLRMMFGTAALVAVALGTQPIGAFLTGPGAFAYLGAAAVFGAVGAAIIAVVGATFRDAVPAGPRATPLGTGAALRALAGNRAFVTLNLAAFAMAVASTVLGKSVLYWFKYGVGDEAAGRETLAAMGIAGALAVPLWIVVGRRLGVRTLWFGFVGMGVLLLLGFGGGGVAGLLPTQAWLVAIQLLLVGFSFAFWAMLPDTIEYGEWTGGVRVEGALFGVAALVQRIGIGVATVLLGLGFAAAGFQEGAAQSTGTLAGMRWTIAGVPALFLTASAVAMAFNPLKRGAHGRLVEGLAARRAGAAV